MNNTLTCPTARELVRELQHSVSFMRANGFKETDVRLQVKESGWLLHIGDSQYDQDHRGYWGASGLGVEMSLADCVSVASDLISQVEEGISQELS